MSERKSNIPQWMWHEYDLHNHPDLRRILEFRFMPYDELWRMCSVPDVGIDVKLWQP